MLVFFLRRLLGAVPVLFAVSLSCSACPAVAGRSGALMAALTRRSRRWYRRAKRWGLTGDRRTISAQARGCAAIRTSSRTHEPVIVVIGARFPLTLWPRAGDGWATLLPEDCRRSCRRKRGRWQTRPRCRWRSGPSFPGFWLGLLLIDLFSVNLGWLPTGGYDGWRSLLMPAFTLGVGVAAVLARFTRSEFVDVAGEDYVRTARSKGLTERRVIWRHAFRNALIPVVTLTGLEFGTLLGGAIVVETVFAWPGLGRLLVDSISFRDYAVIQALILLLSAEFVLINLAIDLLYGVFNPEIRLRS